MCYERIRSGVSIGRYSKSNDSGLGQGHKKPDQDIPNIKPLYYVLCSDKVSSLSLQNYLEWHRKIIINTFRWEIGFTLCFVRPVYKQVSKTSETGGYLIWNQTQKLHSKALCRIWKKTLILKKCTAEFMFSGVLEEVLNHFQMISRCTPSIKLVSLSLILAEVETKRLYLRQYLVAGLQQRPCGSSVPRVLRSDVGSSVESPGLEDPDRHAPHQEIHLPWGRERSGLGGRQRTEQGVYDLQLKNIPVVFFQNSSPFIVFFPITLTQYSFI